MRTDLLHVCLMAIGIFKAIIGPGALVFFPPVPGLHRKRVTPALLHLTRVAQPRREVDRNLSLHAGLTKEEPLSQPPKLMTNNGKE